MPATPTVQPDPQRNTFPPFALIFAVWLIPALLSGCNSYRQYRLDGQRPDWRWVVFNSLAWLLYAGLTPLVAFTAGIKNPVTVSLTVGEDIGSAPVTALISPR